MSYSLETNEYSVTEKSGYDYLEFNCSPFEQLENLMKMKYSMYLESETLDKIEIERDV